MNQIRKDEEKEHVVLRVECEIPTFHKILFIIAYILGAFLIVLGIMLLSKSDGGGGVSLFFGVAIVLPVAISHGIFAYCVHCTNVTITNKTIKGTVVNRRRPAIKYSYNRRLDMIDDVQYVKTLIGIKSLNFTFTQGVDKEIGADNTSKTLSINYVKDAESVYQKISQLIVKVKNDKDVKADIATQQIDAQLKQAKAFETLAEHVTKKEEPVVANDSDEAKQLKQIKELYDDGIISKEDFQKMVKRIIDK